jgi:hypothetical protein
MGKKVSLLGGVGGDDFEDGNKEHMEGKDS